MRAILRLQILLRIPVRIEKNHGVGGREIDALAAGAGAEEEEAMCGVGVEGGDLGAAVGLRDGAVDAADGPVP